MARRDDDQDALVPEADRLEQQQQADPDIGPAQEWPDPPTLDVDEADQLEQAHEVPDDPDEDYAPDLPEE
jgi:hypothetical protein